MIFAALHVAVNDCLSTSSIGFGVTNTFLAKGESANAESVNDED